ncbi:hypothetical protein [Bradyrhizobium nanningense]|uniref:hypothetical protein n=1 Tax=Bradyrhizobium nanningense TaxID=1325118 RepID=UPI0013E8D6A3|nr:hypothetical protein [Bradyrhizobium nanningense]
MGALADTINGADQFLAAFRRAVDQHAIEADRLAANAVKVGGHLLSIGDLKQTHPLIGDVRGKGLAIGAELVSDPGSQPKEKRQFVTCEDRGVPMLDLALADLEQGKVVLRWRAPSLAASARYSVRTDVARRAFNRGKALANASEV